jgi:hypothetical protein
MKQNIDKLLDRDVALNNLVTRADDLQTSATTYNQTTKQLRRKFWWKNAKVQNSSYLLSSSSINLFRQTYALLVLSLPLCLLLFVSHLNKSMN